MKAIQVQSYGDEECLNKALLPTPEPKEHKVLIRNKVIGVNFIDIYMRRGDPMILMPLPFIPGVEGAGYVEKVGRNVKDIFPGDRVSYPWSFRFLC